MALNPHDASLKATRSKFAALRKERDAIVKSLDDYAAFDVSSARSEVDQCRDLLVDFEIELDRLVAEKQSLAKKTRKLTEKAQLGWDPTYWFSAERQRAKDRLHKHLHSLKDLDKRTDRLKRKRTAQRKKRD